MSLVSDALRKARQYATARDIQRHGAAAGAYMPPPRRSRLGLGLVLGAFIALAAAAVGAAFVLWWLGRTEPVPAAAAAAAPVSESAATPTAVIEARPAAERPRPAPSDALGDSPAAEASASVTPPSPTAAATAAAPALAGEAAGGATAEPQATGPAGERVYVLRADLGYAKLQLDFLVYKPSGGFGRINGQDVIQGSIVDGFTVEEFGPDFVRLRDGRGPLVLRTR